MMAHNFWDNAEDDPYFQAGAIARHLLDAGHSHVEVGEQISEYLLPHTPNRKAVIESSPTIKGIVDRIAALPIQEVETVLSDDTERNLTYHGDDNDPVYYLD